jgi:copper chaperone
MLAYQVPDMTCSHCVNTITRAVHAVQPDAVVEADLARHVVQVDLPEAQADAVRQAIVAAGYEAEPAVAAAAAPGAPACGGCGCGGASRHPA